MRLSFVTLSLLLLAFNVLLASNLSGQNINKTRVVISIHKGTLKQVFAQIEQQTTFRFAYPEPQISAYKDIKVTPGRRMVADVLDDVLANTKLKYSLNGNTIIVLENSHKATEKNTIATLINGIVKSVSGEPLEGVSVFIKDTKIGTVTTAGGLFTINVKEGDIVVFSRVGYESKEVIIKDQSSIEVTLDALEGSLDEILVVGYGTQKRENITGAVTQVKMDKVLGDRPVSQLGTLLQNVVPGLQSTIGSGRPGENTDLNLRGATGLNTSGSDIKQDGPLILVDNVPINGNLNLLDPNDIETVTVLKDAGSAAIYGGRSAFGVILITTKKGKANQKPQFNYSNNVIFASAMNLPVKATPEQQLEFSRNGGAANIDEWLAAYRDAQIHPEKYPDGIFTLGSTKLPVFTRDLIKEYIGSNVPQMQQNFSVNGGSEKIQYRLSFGNINEKGIILPESNWDYYKRYNLRSFVSADINKWFTAQVDASYVNSKISRPKNHLGLATNLSVLQYPYSKEPGVFDRTPKGLTLGSAPDITGTSDIRVTGRGIFKPLKGLTITTEYTYDYLNQNQENYDKLFYFTDPISGVVNPSGSGKYELINGSTTYSSLNIFGTYAKSVIGHNFSLTAGYNREESITKENSTSRTGMISADFPSISNATGPLVAVDSYADFSLVGIFARFNYDYKSKYILQLNMRNDGSSKFPANSRFGFFPSGSVGWVVSEEEFFKDNIRSVSQLKFRASWGEVGNQGIDPYQFVAFLPRYQPFWLNGTGSYLTSLNSPLLISSDFTWETVETLNFGIDVGLFKNKLSGTFDWYRRETKDILSAGAVPLPAVLGEEAPLQNTASLRSSGFEISLNWADKINNNISYRIGANLYDYTSKITKFDGNPNNLLNTYYVGQQIGEIWGYTTDRLYQVSDFADGSLNDNLVGGTLKPGIPRFNAQNPNPGDVLYKDLNGDGVVNPGASTLADPGDMSIIGNSAQRYQYGINGGITYKHFDFSFFLRGVGKRQYSYISNLTFPNFSGVGTLYQHTLDYWTPENPNAFFGRLNGLGATNQAANQQTIQTRYLLNGAFLQVSNLSLAYSVPGSLLDKIRITSCKIFSSVENPFTFDHLPKGLDASLNSPRALGYPFLRRVSIGANITF